MKHRQGRVLREGRGVLPTHHLKIKSRGEEHPREGKRDPGNGGEHFGLLWNQYREHSGRSTRDARGSPGGDGPQWLGELQKRGVIGGHCAVRLVSASSRP